MQIPPLLLYLMRAINAVPFMPKKSNVQFVNKVRDVPTIDLMQMLSHHGSIHHILLC